MCVLALGALRRIYGAVSQICRPFNKWCGERRLTLAIAVVGRPAVRRLLPRGLVRYKYAEDRNAQRERFRRKDYGHLDIDVTVDDPKAYTAPWTVTLNQFIVLNTELIDYHCAENEKDTAHFLGK